jgi:hypothetical protein
MVPHGVVGYASASTDGTVAMIKVEISALSVRPSGLVLGLIGAHLIRIAICEGLVEA